MKTTIATLASLLLCVIVEARAEIQLDPIYESHMVLQRGRAVPISGSVTGSGAVEVSFGDQKVSAKVKGKRWKAVLPPMEACAEGKNLVVTQGKDKVEIEDVLVGEVWIASGQSNMLFRLDQTRDKAALDQPAIPEFRFYHAEPKVHTSPGVYNDELLTRLKENRMYEGAWHVGGSGDCPRMSAVGWYFGRKLHELLGVPVAVVHASLGGSEMMAWMPPAVIKKKYKDCLGLHWLDSKYMSAWVRGRARQNIGKDLSAPHPYKPGYLFETGISPWRDFPVAGVIWYQGESDAEIQDQEQNKRLLTDLINGWRTELGQSELPFIQVQLPRIKDTTPLRAYWPEFRAVQAAVARELPKVYCVTTLDLGTTNADVHPPRKLEVGERLAATAAAQVYEKKDIPFSGPVATSVKQHGQALSVKFDYAKGLHSKDGKPIAGFELSSDGKKFVPATAEITNGDLLVRAEGMTKPKIVRYGWAVFMEPNLVNSDDLPATPFTLSLEGGRKKSVPARRTAD